jgi:hypothetical protein
MAKRLFVLTARLAPVLSTGLFSGRIASEWWAIRSGNAVTGTPQWGAILITVLTTVAAHYALRGRNIDRTWPLLPLAIYVVWPSTDFSAATVIAGSSLIAGYLVHHASNRAKGIGPVPALQSVLVFIGAAILYLITISPDVLPADSGEFQLVATHLGIAHPPGFPLYTLLGNLFSRLPLGSSPALRVTMLSVVTSSLTVMVVYITIVRATGRKVAGLAGAIALGSSTTFWSQATTANIRSLTALFTALAIWSVLHYTDAVRLSSRAMAGASRDSLRSGMTKRDRWLTLFVFILSSGILHHGSLIFLGTILVAFALLSDRSLISAPRRWIWPGLALLLSLLPLLYLPWRAWAFAQGVPVRGASLGLSNLQGLLDHLLARGFQGDLFFYTEPALFWERLRVMANVLQHQFSPFLLAGMAVGLLVSWIRVREQSLLLVLAFVSHLVVTATYRAPQTVEYMLPAYVVAAIVLGYGVGKVEEVVRMQRPGVAAPLGTLIATTLLLYAVVQTAANLPSFRYLHQQTETRDYAQLLLDGAPDDAVILADWHWATPLWYLQESESLRQDVAVRFVFPTAEPYATTWARRIAEELEQGLPVIATHYDASTFNSLPVPEPLGDAHLYWQQPRLALPDEFVGTELYLEDAIAIVGYHLDLRRARIGRPLLLTLAWQPIEDAKTPGKMFAHLVGADGAIVAQEDPPASARADGLTLTQFRLTPRPGTLPGEYDILIGAYEVDGQAATEPSPRTHLASVSISPMTYPPVTLHPTTRFLSGERSSVALFGYDWDYTLSRSGRLYLHWMTEAGYVTEVRHEVASDSFTLPEHVGPWGIVVEGAEIRGHGNTSYVPFGEGIVWTGAQWDGTEALSPGQVVWLRQTFESGLPISRDIATAVRLVGYDEDEFRWQWSELDDEFGIPALGAIPTLKWIAGSKVTDVHQLTVAGTAYSGQSVGFILGLHDTFTNRPLPILDERFARDTPWLRARVSP